MRQRILAHWAAGAAMIESPLVTHRAFLSFDVMSNVSMKPLVPLNS
jgi:hypothetical protein